MRLDTAAVRLGGIQLGEAGSVTTAAALSGGRSDVLLSRRSRSDRGLVEESGGVLLYASGTDFPFVFNGVVRTDPAVPGPEVLARADAFFDQLHRGYTVVTAPGDEDLAAHVDQLLRQVLLTAPGERVNRPDFGCGLRAHLGLERAQLDVAATPGVTIEEVEELIAAAAAEERAALDALADLDAELLERERLLALREASLAGRAGSLLAAAQALYDEVLGGGPAPLDPLADDELARLRRRKSVA